MSSSSELSSTSASQTQSLSSIVNDVDPEVAAIIGKEERRQRRGLELIASENFASAPGEITPCVMCARPQYALNSAAIRTQLNSYPYPPPQYEPSCQAA